MRVGVGICTGAGVQARVRVRLRVRELMAFGAGFLVTTSSAPIAGVGEMLLVTPARDSPEEGAWQHVPVPSLCQGSPSAPRNGCWKPWGSSVCWSRAMGVLLTPPRSAGSGAPTQP